jgi:hypothetical protein
MVRTPFAGWGLLPLCIAAALGFAATACTSSDDSSPVTTDAAATTGTDSIEPTTSVDVAPGADAPCTADALALAGSAAGPGATYDTVDSYGCEGGYAWAWLADSSNQTGALVSEIFIDDGDGSWSLVSLDEVCGPLSTGVPEGVLANGCRYFGDGDASGAPG